MSGIDDFSPGYPDNYPDANRSQSDMTHIILTSQRISLRIHHTPKHFPSVSCIQEKLNC